ncbi:MAG TPA: trehalase family glycosidase [Bacteroidota bacterium]|nr:trehalase family glycosidase [Bacteroidota bacterium]
MRRDVHVSVQSTLDSLLRDEDTDGDRRITVEDRRILGTDRGDKRFWIRTGDSGSFEVDGTYELSNLLAILIRAKDSGIDTCTVDPTDLFERPTAHLSKMIREVYWDGLTRRIDSMGLQSILPDQKMSTADEYHYLYVPADDSASEQYFTQFVLVHKALKTRVVTLPAVITAEDAHALSLHSGLLVLGLQHNGDGEYHGRPYVVPGGRFNEMYGWDSYFIILGLLEDGKVDLAKSMVDNLVYEIRHFGKILNANRTYYLTRSQPPFLTSMMRAVYAAMDRSDASKAWLGEVLDAAIKEYTNVWMNGDHLTRTGLSRYFDTGTGPCPEVEPGHYDEVYAKYAKKYGMDIRSFEQAYRSGRVNVPELDAYFVNDRAMRESGHDTSYRLVGRCAELLTVDLNSLLYKIETDIADVILNEFGGSYRTSDGTTENSKTWSSRANHRRELMNKYLWNDRKGMFFDYDFIKERQTGYVSATTFYPLWAGLATPHQAELLVKKALPLLEVAGGMAGSSEASRGPLSADRKPRQWDYPNGWAPHQMLAWKGFQNYGFDDVARRLAYRWLYTITLNAVNYSGMITEKFDVVRRTHDVFAEYGNVGVTATNITREGFGWTNASYQVGLTLLTEGLRKDLDALLPPEWIMKF